MRVAITGATGFVGSHLLATLKQCNIEPIPLVRQSSGLALERIFSLAASMHEMRKCVEHCDAVVHLAARVHVMRETADSSLSAFRISNVVPTANLTTAAAEAGVKRFIYMSSAKIYGNVSLPGHPFCNDDVPAPEDPYAISKMEAEEGVRRISSRAGMQAIIIRPPLIYGPGVRGNFASLVRLVARGLPLPFGHIDNARSMIGVQNLNSLVAHCLVHPAFEKDTFCATDNHDLSTTELIRLIATTLHIDAHLIPVPRLWLEVACALVRRRDLSTRLLGNFQVDCKETCRVLDWQPPLTVAEGIRATVDDLMGAHRS